MNKIVRLEEWEIKNHRKFLDDTDECFYYFTYYPYSDLFENKGKQLIKNLKITMSELIAQPSRKKYKKNSITNVSQWLIDTINQYPILTEYLWVPIPPSSTREAPEYDNRLLDILTLVKEEIEDFRFADPLSINKSVEKSSKSNARDVNEKFNNLILKDNLIPFDITKIIIFDDVLTTGSTFKAVKLKLATLKNIQKIIGIFIAKSNSQDEVDLTGIE